MKPSIYCFSNLKTGAYHAMTTKFNYVPLPTDRTKHLKIFITTELALEYLLLLSKVHISW